MRVEKYCNFPFSVKCQTKITVVCVVEATTQRIVPQQDFSCQKLLGMQSLLVGEAHL